MRKCIADAPASKGEWPLGLRIGLSLILGAHFLGVLLAPIALPMGRHPAPELASSLHRPLSPWLNASLLNQPWRFFAPEPGPISIQLFRVEFQDGSAFWIDHPHLDRFEWRKSALQRELAQAMRLEGELRPQAANPQELELSPAGLHLAGSYSRHVARSAESAKDKPKSIQIWVLHHYPRTREQVRIGWDAEDLRLWSACGIGRFTPDGEAVNPPENPAAVPIPMLAALWITDNKNPQPAMDVPSVFHGEFMKHHLHAGMKRNVQEIASHLSEQLAAWGTDSASPGPTRSKR
jgi:hypothetical protein